MRERIATALARTIVKRPGIIAIIILAVVGLSVWQMTRLTINYNQLELVPQDLPSVVATKEMSRLAGGYGNLYIVLRSDNLEHMKRVADDLTAELGKVPEIRKAECKQDVAFIRDHLAYFIDYPDLKEAYDLLRQKIRTMTRDKMGMKGGEDATDARLKALVEKYRNVNSKFLDDEYNIDPSKKLLMIVISAKGIPNDLDFSKKLLDDVNAILKKYAASNKQNARLVELYGGKMAPDSTVTYGITGEYKITYEDSMQMQRALAPVSIVSFAGIAIYMLILLRRPTQILLIMSVLLMSVAITFGFTKITLGELNSITAILGAVLMGFGIDFGIHFIYRLREEFSHRKDMEESFRQTLLHSGMSSFISALTSAASLFVLVMADFKGFSHFGLISGVGILVTASMMYIFLPVAYVLIDRVWPSFKNNLIVDFKSVDQADRLRKPFPFVTPILSVTLVLTAVLAYMGTRIQFDYDSRSFMTGHTDALVLQDELEAKFNLKGLPSVVYTDTLEETRKLTLALKDKKRYPLVENVLSVFTIAPSEKDQMKTRLLLDQIQERLDMVDRDLFKGEELKIFELVEKSLKAQPFTIDEVPPALLKQFRPVPESGARGYFTLIIPGGSVTDSKRTIEFTKQVGTIEVDGKKYHSTGHMILMANLAMIVIRDGKIFPAFAAALILVIILISYRDPRALIFAMVPLLGGMLWMLGLMFIFNWKINYVNIVVFPVVLGYGISSGIHVYNRYLESRSVMTAIRHTGAAVAGSSITTLIGWGSLFFSNHRGLTSMGALAVFGIAASLIVTFTVMSALLQFAEDRKIFTPHGEG